MRNLKGSEKDFSKINDKESSTTDSSTQSLRKQPRINNPARQSDLSPPDQISVPPADADVFHPSHFSRREAATSVLVQRSFTSDEKLPSVTQVHVRSASLHDSVKRQRRSAGAQPVFPPVICSYLSSTPASYNLLPLGLLLVDTKERKEEGRNSRMR
ncbi:unnamed protein product [Pleuronectes platessa]|uniref:Uncharacterized protein n=1 Tax=Pleuronectes platessa TaxID=8262 RepID=A0A9N7VPZ4_PLEPL|nr:unnamed protein product [Pleuronectes platessa]